MNSQYPESLLLIGAGKMGSALLRAWIASGMPEESISVVDQASTAQDVFQSVKEIKNIPECIVLAVKPQSLDALLPEVHEQFGCAPLYVSIAAGKPVAYFRKHLGKNAAIVRAMPNTPALISKGITALYADINATPHQKQVAQLLLQACGKTVWLANETDMDAVTAVSGSGPAYVFLFIEALVDAGLSQGLSQDVAYELAIETVLGSAELAKQSCRQLPQLRADVTSKGGTTEAALSILLKDDRFHALLEEAVAAAVKRARELAQ